MLCTPFEASFIIIIACVTRLQLEKFNCKLGEARQGLACLAFRWECGNSVGKSFIFAIIIIFMKEL